MSQTTIVETNGIDADKIDVSRWTDYGKDRLYVNRFGSGHDSVYVDLNGDEGHSTWAGASFDVDGETVEIEWVESGLPRNAGREPRSKRAVLEVEN